MFPAHIIEFLSQRGTLGVSVAGSSSGNVAPKLSPSLGSVARRHDNVTLLFLDIVGFTSMSKVRPPCVTAGVAADHRLMVGDGVQEVEPGQVMNFLK
jgi:class 3 adenylate cyclase